MEKRENCTETSTLSQPATYSVSMISPSNLRFKASLELNLSGA